MPPPAPVMMQTFSASRTRGPSRYGAALESGGQNTSVRRGDWPGGLSNREVEVLRLAVRGHANRAIARELVISERTVAHHLEHAYGKIGVAGRGAAALWAIRNGLLTDLEAAPD